MQAKVVIRNFLKMRDIMEQNNNAPEPDEIQLVELIRKVWEGRKIVIAIGSAFVILGIIFALLSKNVYVASTTFIPKGKVKGSASGSISGLASLAGINLGSMSGDNSEIPPSLYPMLVKSNPFIERILRVKVPKNGSLIQFEDYIDNPQETTGTHRGTPGNPGHPICTVPNSRSG